VVIEHGFPAVVIAPSGDMSTEMGRFMRTLKQRQAEILVISDAAEILDQAHIELQLPLHRHLLRRLSFEVRLHFTSSCISSQLMYFEPLTYFGVCLHFASETRKHAKHAESELWIPYAEASFSRCRSS